MSRHQQASMTLWKAFRFEAAHLLPKVVEGHKCARLHGHSYRFEVHVHGVVDQFQGWVMDYGVLTDLVAPLRHLLDHSYLNSIPGLENPTAENLARWLWHQIRDGLEGLPGEVILDRIVVQETESSGCVFEGVGA